jgi:hypothetical protein
MHVHACLRASAQSEKDVWMYCMGPRGCELSRTMGSDEVFVCAVWASRTTVVNE